MKPRTLRILFLVSLVIFLFSRAAYSQDKDFFYRGKNLARKGNLDFAFSYFNMISTIHPESRYAKDSLFAVGEYYFLQGDTRNAKKAFSKFVGKYSETEAKLFALTYLFKIANTEKDLEKAEEIKKEIVSFKQLSLLFKDFEEIEYSSALSNKYKATYFIDRVDIYINEELLAQIPF